MDFIFLSSIRLCTYTVSEFCLSSAGFSASRLWNGGDFSVLGFSPDCLVSKNAVCICLSFHACRAHLLPPFCPLENTF